MELYKGGYIDREVLHYALDEFYFTGEKLLRETIDSVPAADVVEVVRCKDCRDCMEFTPEYKEKSGYYGTCRRLLFPMLDDDDARIMADDYCSYGERKEGQR